MPPIPPELRTQVEPYLNLGGASFRGWHSTRREAIVTTRIGDASHLHLMAAPLAKRVALTGGTEPAKGGQMQPGGSLLLYSADEPPSMRGLVELDAVDGRVLGEYTERNPEDWSEFGL